MDTPASLGLAALALAAGGAAGAGLGALVGRNQQPEDKLGKIAGGTVLGVLAASLGGVAVAALSPKYRPAGLWAAGLGVGAVVLLLGVGEAKAAAQLPPANQLQPGGSYVLTLSCPTPLIPVPTGTIPTSWASNVLAGVPANVTAVQASGTVPTSNSQVSLANSLAVTFTYTGTSVMALPPIVAGNGTACSTALVPA